MTLKTRRILYIIFIIIFLLISTVVILYSAGYRYHFKKLRFQKSGGILLEFSPKEVDIYVQGKLTEITGFLDDSYKITGMLPGEYAVKIEKDGYHGWEKKLRVESEKINFAKDIVLFKKETLPKLITNGDFSGFKYSPMRDKMFITQRRDDDLLLNIYNEGIDKSINIASFKSTSTEEINLLFSSRGKKLLTQINEANYIYTFNEQKLDDLKEKIQGGLNITKPHWDKNTDEILYFLSNNEIYQLNLFNYTIKKLETQKKTINKIADFDIIDDNIYLIIKDGDKFILEKVNKNSGGKTLFLENISPNFSFIPSPKPYLTLLNKTDKKLIVIKADSKEIILQDNAKNVSWSPKVNSGDYIIIYNNDFEIYTYDTMDRERNLITRRGKIINNISWYPDYAHLVFSEEDSINIIELDKYRKKIITTLFKGGKIEDIITSRSGEKIYFRGSIGGQIGFFELEIE